MQNKSPTASMKQPIFQIERKDRSKERNGRQVRGRTIVTGDKRDRRAEEKGKTRQRQRRKRQKR